MTSSAPFRSLAGAIALVLASGLAAVALGVDDPAELAVTRAALVGPAEGGTVVAVAGEAVPVVGPLVAAAPASSAPVEPAPTGSAPAADAAESTPGSPSPAAPAPAAPAPAASPPARAASADPAPVDTAATRDPACEANVLRWANQARAERGLPALAGDGGIAPIAVSWSDEMAQRHHLAHSPDYGARIFAARPQATVAGENVGWTTNDDRAVFDEFMRSPGHRDKILSAEFSHAAVGCVVDDAGERWVTHHFWG